VSFLLISKQFLQTERPHLVSFCKLSLSKLEINCRVIERNAINKFIFEFGDGFSNADNSANIGNNQKLWNIIPHWTSRFEIYPKE
jgi:hypothetical protein